MGVIYGKPGNLQRPYCCDGFEVLMQRRFWFYGLAYRFVRKQIISVLRGAAQADSAWERSL